MTDLEVIGKLTKENERLQWRVRAMHARIVALSARVTDLEVTVDNYASKQEHLINELAEERARAELIKDLHDERFDNWTDTKWGA